MRFAGLDLGGSKAALCCVDDSGATWERVIPVTPESAAGDVLVEAIAALQEFASTRGALRRIAIASAPSMDRSGTITRWPNRPQWEGTPLATTLSQRLECEVRWCDDGTAATLADAAKLEVRNLLHFSLGTGVGGGIVVDGTVLEDRELGHLIVHPNGHLCSCGRMGCLQAYASASAFLRAAPHTTLQERDWTHQAATSIALCTANLVELFRPDTLSLSGGLLGRFPHLPSLVAEKLADNCVKHSLKMPHVVASPHGTRASLAGALLLAGTDAAAHSNTYRSTTDGTA